jgi:hypothetical protein
MEGCLSTRFSDSDSSVPLGSPPATCDDSSVQKQNEEIEMRNRLLALLGWSLASAAILRALWALVNRL